MSDLVKRLRHPKESLYGTLMYLFGAVFWLAIAAVVVVALKTSPFALLPLVAELVVILVVLGIARLFLRAYVYGHYVLVGPDQFPHLDAMVRAGAAEIGLERAPLTFVFNSQGSMNAMALKLIGRRHVWLTSALLDADSDAQVRFVVGHELAHHACGHLDWWRNVVKFPGHFVPFLGPAYSRARELTCDRVGCWLAHDLEASRGALQMLACGSARLNAAMNPTAFQAQEALVPPITGWLLNAFSGYPRLTRRVAELGAYYAAPTIGR